MANDDHKGAGADRVTVAGASVRGGGDSRDGVRGGVPDQNGRLEIMMRMRAAYRACARVGVEVDYCERRIAEIDRGVRAYIADRT